MVPEEPGKTIRVADNCHFPGWDDLLWNDECGNAGFTLLYLIIAVVAGAGVQAILPYELTQQNALQQVRGAVEEPTVETKPKKQRLKIQDLEEEELPAETDNKVQLIENPLPVPKKHVPKVLDYKLNDDVSDFDYPVADDDDFDH